MTLKKVSVSNLTEPAWDTWSYKKAMYDTWSNKTTKAKSKTPTEDSLVNVFRKGVQGATDLGSLRLLADSIIDHLDATKKQLHGYREKAAQLSAENDSLRAELNEPQEDI